MHVSDTTPTHEPPALASATPEEPHLLDLVYHRGSLRADHTLDEAQRILAVEGIDFLPVVDEHRSPIGLCSRVHMGQLLGTRYGFSLHGRSPVASAMVERPLVVASSKSLSQVASFAMARGRSEFGEDVILVDEAGILIGLIRAETLAQAQSQLVAEQMRALREQRAQLQRQNVDLFRANNEIRQSKGLYFGLFENHALGVALLDPEGIVQARNRRLAEMLALGEETRFSLTDLVTDRERGDFRRMLAACQAGRATAPSREFTIQVTGAGARTFRCSMGWISETGQACVCLDDITEQRSLEGQVALREKQSLLESLIGGIAHELNNKLTPVRGFAELLQMEPSPQAQAYATLIARSVDEASRIVKQLRELTAYAGPDARRIDLRTAVEDALVMLQFRLQEAGCALRRELPADPVWVRADAGQVKQVVMNLGVNAIDAMTGRSGALLWVSLRSEGGLAHLAVADNGVGIPLDAQRRIFDPFYTTKGPERGTGLGLSICLSILRQIGGEIALASIPGEGATFEVTLPLVGTEEAAAIVLPKETRETRSPAFSGGTLEILVADDEEVIRHLLQEQLRRSFNCRVTLAVNGQDALMTLAGMRFDLILVDVLMPVMGGHEFYAALLKRDEGAAQRVIFITGYAGGENVEAELARWKRPVLAKPFNHEELENACRRVLAQSEKARNRSGGE